jgi:hypothetical protein
MTTMMAIIVFLIFLFISSIHFYWAFGGYWGSDAVLPTKADNNTKFLNPTVLPTLIVAFGVLGFGLFVLLKSGLIALYYVGFFKKIKQTKFGKNDTKYFSPLCLTIGILTIILELTI